MISEVFVCPGGGGRGVPSGSGRGYFHLGPRGFCLGPGGSVQDHGFCLGRGGGSDEDPPPESEQRAERILLECFLVTYYFLCSSQLYI